ncbi:MAG: Mov34/MPN/PAD-1 family protein [Promethearchaeota archaeon]
MSERISIKQSEEERERTEEGKVIIQKGAFRNMITHVLRFGSEALEQSVEVMGICMGKTAPNGKDLIVMNAIPVAHGSREQVAFTPEDLAAFAEIDEQYASKGLYAIGWYHSHPGWGLFFSDMDKKNHLFYQKKQTPYAFGIVFDHTLMGKDGNLGFEIYRLKDYTKGWQSDYIKVAYEVEVPKTLNFFKWIQKFMEDSQKKSPIFIKEIKELTAPVQGDLQAIPKPEKGALEGEELDQYPEITPIISGFQQATSQFSELFMENLKVYLGNWTRDISEGTIKGNVTMRNSLNQMREAISYGIIKVQNWFENNLNEIIDNFKNDVSEYLDVRIKEQKALVEFISKTKGDLTNELNKLIEEKIIDLTDKIDSKIKNEIEKTNNLDQINSKLENQISNTSEKISTVNNEVTKITEELSKDIDDILSPFEREIVSKFENLYEEGQKVKSLYSEFSNLFEKLQKVIMSLRNL